MQEGFYRDTWVEVNLDAISQNVSAMKKLIGEQTKIIAVVKANAYGHGAIQVAHAALESGASMLAVAFLDEAIQLRQAGFDCPILVMGATRAQDVHVAVSYGITLTIFSLDWAKEASHYVDQGDVLLHVKVDTGMGRLGVRGVDELQAILEFAQEHEHFHIEGIFTHFATADETNSPYYLKQLTKFQEVIADVPKGNLLIHCANSAAGLKDKASLYNAVRQGISMYGLTPSVEMKKELPFELHEAFSLKTKLVHVKQLKKGDKVSYGATYEAEESEWIGTLPIGYADGWLRKLQDSEVLIEGKRMQLVGRICMDQCMVKLPYELPVGTNVTLIGRQGNEVISSDEVAERLETINYEVPCTISSRVPRIFFKKQRIIEKANPLLLKRPGKV
ncbi:alanine racemase [Bacillus weihaiensis]|uniref:alanine racemase n=1 Tax=Bacillus weihaiensis TaxID=1547283 RepID=UPI002355E272|nr:alanine racemase [Bacillus weihaiensis]